MGVKQERRLTTKAERESDARSAFGLVSEAILRGVQEQADLEIVIHLGDGNVGRVEVEEDLA